MSDSYTAGKVSLIIPVFNEEGHLTDFLNRIDRIDLGVKKELVIIDDHSTDKSAEIIGRFKFQSEYQFLQCERNGGKGAALRKGIELATGDVIGIQDADFEYNMDDIPNLIGPIFNGSADVVYGSRFKKSNRQVHRTYHYLVNRFLTLLSNLFSGLYLTDMETCYKFFKADIIQNIKFESNRFGFEPEVTAKIARLKVRVLEIPISYFPRNYLEGKKITWKDGVAALRHILVFNLFRKSEEITLPSMPNSYKLDNRQWL